jgi:MFS family permease
MKTENDLKTENPTSTLTPPTPALVENPKRNPFSTLQNRDYRLMLFGQSISQVGTQMYVAAVGWQIYQLTHDPFQLGLIGICRVGPLILCSLIGGSVADSVDRRRLLLLTQTILMLCTLALALVTITGIVTPLWIYGLMCLASATDAFDRPTYSALLPALVPREQLPAAISLNMVSWQTATVVGPGLGGITIALVGVQGAYWADAISYLAVIAALLMIHFRPVATSGRKVSIALALEGLRFVGGQKILIFSMLLDFFATFFSSATTLLPIFATDVLHTNEIGFGLLSAAQSVGAVITSIIMASLSINNIRNPGKLLLIAVFFFSIFTVLFGISTSLPLSLLWLALVGASDTVSMVLRQTIAQLSTPDEMRGRMQSVNMIFFAGGPQLGELEAGIVARIGGAPLSVISGGIICTLVVILIAVSATQLREY